MAGLAVPSTYRSGDIHGRQREILTGTHPLPTHPCEDLLYIQLQGRAPRAGPGLAAVHAKAPRGGGADCGAAQHLPITGWPPRGTVARRGAGYLPLALRAASAPPRTHPRDRPHGLRAATSAVARGAANGAIPPAPHSEALRARGQDRSLRSRRCAIPSGLWTAAPPGFRGRLSEGWPGPSAADAL